MALRSTIVGLRRPIGRATLGSLGICLTFALSGGQFSS